MYPHQRSVEDWEFDILEKLYNLKLPDRVPLSFNRQPNNRRSATWFLTEYGYDFTVVIEIIRKAEFSDYVSGRLFKKRPELYPGYSLEFTTFVAKAADILNGRYDNWNDLIKKKPQLPAPQRFATST